MQKIGIVERKIVSQNSDNQCEKLSSWMKKIMIRDKFEVGKSAREMCGKIYN